MVPPQVCYLKQATLAQHFEKGKKLLPTVQNKGKVTLREKLEQTYLPLEGVIRQRLKYLKGGPRMNKREVWQMGHESEKANKWCVDGWTVGDRGSL